MSNPGLPEVGSTLISPAAYNIATLETLQRPGALDQIPDLLTSLKRWKDDDFSLLLWRETVLGRAQVPMRSMMFAYAWLTHHQAPFLFLRHEPVGSIPEKRAVLAAHQEQIAPVMGLETPKPVKTVTLKIGAEDPVRVVVTSLDRNIDKAAKAAIAQDLGLPNSALKNMVINPEDGWDPYLHLGALPGVIGPFMMPRGNDHISRCYFLQDDTSAQAPIEVAMSYFESLILQRGTFERLMRDYEDQFITSNRYIHIRV